MTKPRFKSGSWRKRKMKTPGKRLVEHHRRKKPKLARCGRCGKLLHGIPRGRVIEMKHWRKSEKRPERPYGGNLCSSCMRELFRVMVRQSK